MILITHSRKFDRFIDDLQSYYLGETKTKNYRCIMLTWMDWNRRTFIGAREAFNLTDSDVWFDINLN